MKFTSLIWFALFWPCHSGWPLDRETECQCDRISEGNLPRNRPVLGPTGRIVGEKKKMDTQDELSSAAAIIVNFEVDCSIAMLSKARDSLVEKHLSPSMENNRIIDGNIESMPFNMAIESIQIDMILLQLAALS